MPDHFRAFTVAELGEMLPGGLARGTRDSTALVMGNSGGYFWLHYRNPMTPENKHPDDQVIGAHTEADARAKMLVYLLENKLI